MFYYWQLGHWRGAAGGADAGGPRPAQRGRLAARGAAPPVPRAAGAAGQVGQENKKTWILDELLYY